MSDLFLKILNFSINASWLILVVLVLRLLLKKAPKWIFCVLWGLVGIRLICPVTLKSVLSLLPSSEVIPQNITVVQKPAIYTGVAFINSTVNPVISRSFAPEVGDSVNPLQIVAAAASAIWVVGMAAMVIYMLISYIRLKRSVRVSVSVDRNIRICDGIKTPFILGMFRPVICVPSNVDRKMMEFVIAHEKAHLKRYDHWWKPLGFLLLSVYWFNPLCWISYILLCRDIEAACDEKVIREKDRAYIADYSQALLELSMPGKMVSACPLAFGETGVKSRVKGVLNYKKPAFWLVVVAVISCIAAGVCFLTDPVSAKDPLSGETTMRTNGVDIYYYSGNIADGKTIIDFSISLKPDGTFSWYETPISSFIGMGKYEIRDGILTLMNDGEMTGNTDVNRFRLENDKLYFIAEGSSNFPQVKLDDGAEFVLGVNPIEGWLEQAVEVADVKEAFLSWIYTTNLDNRWAIYQNEVNSLLSSENDSAGEEDIVSGDSASEEKLPGIVLPAADIQEKMEAATARYYSPIAEFTSEELIQQMIRNRTPMSEDNMYMEYGVEMKFVDVIFGEGREDPFISGLIYDFDARVIVDGYERFPNYAYTPDEEGYFHMTGQITVDEGLVTRIYFSKP